MTVHRYHPRQHDSPVLFDDCERCEQHATYLWSIDPSRLMQLRRRNLDDLTGRSRNEQKAMDNLQTWTVAVHRSEGLARTSYEEQQSFRRMLLWVIPISIVLWWLILVAQKPIWRYFLEITA